MCTHCFTSNFSSSWLFTNWNVAFGGIEMCSDLCCCVFQPSGFVSFFPFPRMGDSPSSFLGYFWDICSLTIRCTILEVRGTGMKLYFQKSSDTEKNFKVFCKATVPYVQYPMPVRRMFYFFDLGIKHCCYCHRYAIQYIYSEAVLHGKPAVQ